MTLSSEEGSFIATHNFLISFIENYALSIISCMAPIQDLNNKVLLNLNALLNKLCPFG